MINFAEFDGARRRLTVINNFAPETCNVIDGKSGQTVLRQSGGDRQFFAADHCRRRHDDRRIFRRAQQRMFHLADVCGDSFLFFLIADAPHGYRRIFDAGIFPSNERFIIARHQLTCLIVIGDDVGGAFPHAQIVALFEPLKLRIDPIEQAFDRTIFVMMRIPDPLPMGEGFALGRRRRIGNGFALRCRPAVGLSIGIVGAMRARFAAAFGRAVCAADVEHAGYRLRQCSGKGAAQGCRSFYKNIESRLNRRAESF